MELTPLFTATTQRARRCATFLLVRAAASPRPEQEIPRCESLRPWRRCGERGFFLVELLVGILILSAALIPMYHVFVTSKRNVFSSKMSYMAVHAAREELEEIRQLPFQSLVDGTVEHEFRPVEGHVLDATFEQLEIADPPDGLQDDLFSYPEEYQRIETKVSVLETDPPDPRMKRVVLLVRWQEKGTSPEEGERGFRKALSRYETIVANHRIQ